MLHNILIILASVVGYLTFGAVIVGISCRTDLIYFGTTFDRGSAIVLWPILVVIGILAILIYIPMKLVDFIENFKFRHPND